MYYSIERDPRDRPHDPGGAPGHTHGDHGHQPAGLHLEDIDTMNEQHLRDHHDQGRNARQRGEGRGGKVRHSHRQQAYLRDAHRDAARHARCGRKSSREAIEGAVSVAKTLDRAAKDLNIDFIGGYSALVHKGFTTGDSILN